MTPALIKSDEPESSVAQKVLDNLKLADRVEAADRTGGTALDSGQADAAGAAVRARRFLRRLVHAASAVRQIRLVRRPAWLLHALPVCDAEGRGSA